MQVCDIPINQNLRETTEHGSPAFPFALYRTYLSRNVLGFVNWHWHDEIQLCLITDGTVRFSVQDQDIVLTRGEGILINSKVLHRCLPEVPNPSNSYICIDFAPRLISGFTGSVLESKFIGPFINSSCRYLVFESTNSEDPAILSLMKEIVNSFESDSPVKEMFICSNLLRIMACVIQKSFSYQHQIPDTGNFAFAQKVIEYLERNIKEEISLEDIEKEVGLCKEEICRKFRRAVNLSVFQYLKQIRIEKAALLLTEDNKTVERIALECGFRSTSYFCKTFKETTGLSPLKYKNRK